MPGSKFQEKILYIIRSGRQTYKHRHMYTHNNRIIGNEAITWWVENPLKVRLPQNNCLKLLINFPWKGRRGK